MTLFFLLDVIEHVRADRDLVKGIITKHLNPGGYLIITVPAVDWLFTQHDTYLGHYRRYSPQSLRACLNCLGALETSQGFLFVSLLPVRFCEWGLEKIVGIKAGRRGIGHWKGKGWLTRFIISFFNREHHLLFGLNRLGLRIPGLSIWMVLRKETGHGG